MPVNKALREIGRVIGQLTRRRGLVSLPPLRPSNQSIPPRALISYITAAFDSGKAGDKADPHTNLWECRQIAETFRQFGYGVDVIDWDDRRFTPKKPYEFLVDIGCNLERLAPLVGPDCTKILHATGKHWLFQNRAEYQRLEDLRIRRGAVLLPRRTAPAGFGVEAADCLTVMGNESTVETLRYAGKPCHRIPLSTTAEYPWDDTKDFSWARRRFLWLGKNGMVHKGLDLTLEAFAKLPELQLTVCGPVKLEPDFERLYRRELYELPNIRTVGWVDLAGAQFAEITRECGTLLNPSCSESCSGSVVTCLHAGVTTIVSRESGVDVDGFGVVLEDCTVDQICAAVIGSANRSADDLRARSLAGWQFARAEHTRARFAEKFSKVIESLVSDKRTRQK